MRKYQCHHDDIVIRTQKQQLDASSPYPQGHSDGSQHDKNRSNSQCRGLNKRISHCDPFFDEAGFWKWKWNVLRKDQGNSWPESA